MYLSLANDKKNQFNNNIYQIKWVGVKYAQRDLFA